MSLLRSAPWRLTEQRNLGSNSRLRDPGIAASAGAGFLVVIAVDITIMPGLPKVPSANNIRLNADGDIEELF